MTEKERFALLCEEEAQKSASQGEGIGTYAEKRLHRILKRWVCDDASCYEVSVGRYIADVLTEDGIFEIQTGSFRPMVPKLRSYLEQTDFHVTLIHPVFSRKNLIRVDRESGEILRRRKSPRGERVSDALPSLYDVGEFLTHPRVSVILLCVEADEFRYSERIRYRRAGAYDADLFPRALCEEKHLDRAEDYRVFLPNETSFTASEYGACFGLKGRKLYSALNLLCKIGILRRESEAKRYRYFQVFPT